MPQASSHDKSLTLRTLVELALPYKKRFVIIAILALLGTGADLLQPLIYRIAINDVAGLFVERPAEPQAAEPADEIAPLPPTAKPAPTPAHKHKERPQRKEREEELVRSGRTQLPHLPNFVAPRTKIQTVSTLLWAVTGLFLISVIGYWLTLAADYQSTIVASHVEAN